MKTVVISQPMYFPWVGLLEQMRLADVFVHLDDAQFSKGGFFNRVQLKTAEGTPWLTVPLAETKLGQSLNETRMAEHDWRRKQLATLRQSYAAVPHVEEMLGLVESVLEIEHESLAALSAASVAALAAFFEITPKEIQWASAMGIEGTGWDVGQAVRFLLSDQARYITGQTLVVDGGTTLRGPPRRMENLRT